MAIPFAKVFDAFLKCTLQTIVFRLASHGFPALDQKVETGNDAPHSGRTLA
jgi:hypothetical protein